MEPQALYTGRAILSVELHPFYSNSALEGVTEDLNARVLRWDDGLNGLLLSYNNLQSIPARAAVRPHFAFIQLKVACDVLVFKPTVGMALSGRVNKLGADFIGYKILGSINGAVGRQNIRKDLTYHPRDGCWACKDDPRSKIDLGSDVLFSVHGLQVGADGVLTVWGSMKEPWTGATSAAAFTWPSAFPDQRLARDEEAVPSLSPMRPMQAGTSTAGEPSGKRRPSGMVEQASASQQPAGSIFNAQPEGTMQEGRPRVAAPVTDGGQEVAGGSAAVANGGLEGVRKKKRKKSKLGEELAHRTVDPAVRLDGSGATAASEFGDAAGLVGDRRLPNGVANQHRGPSTGRQVSINDKVGEDVKFGLEGQRPKIRKLTEAQSAAWGEFPSIPDHADVSEKKRKKKKKKKLSNGSV